MVAVQTGRGTCWGPHADRCGWVRSPSLFQPGPQAASLGPLGLLRTHEASPSPPSLSRSSLPFKVKLLLEVGGFQCCPTCVPSPQAQAFPSQLHWEGAPDPRAKPPPSLLLLLPHEPQHPVRAAYTCLLTQLLRMVSTWSKAPEADPEKHPRPCTLPQATQLRMGSEEWDRRTAGTRL